MKLTFIKPGSVIEGTIQNVEVANRGNNSFLEISWISQGQTLRESHFMTNYEEIVETLSKIDLDVNTDTDTWVGTPAKLLVESNNGYLNVTPVGKAEGIDVSGDPIDFSATEVEEPTEAKSVDDLLG